MKFVIRNHTNNIPEMRSLIYVFALFLATLWIAAFTSPNQNGFIHILFLFAFIVIFYILLCGSRGTKKT
jgi:hypothetical protein